MSQMQATIRLAALAASLSFAGIALAAPPAELDARVEELIAKHGVPGMAVIGAPELPKSGLVALARGG